ncbi:MAG: hypothetical protein AB8F78_08455 [Saprospiraceae bacterium]
MSNSTGASRLLPFLIVLLVGTLGVTAWLAYDRNEVMTQRDDMVVQLDETNTLKRDVEKQYYESLNELEEMRGSNEELNTLIDSQKADLTDSKKRIDALMRDKRNLGKVRNELAGLKEQTASYVVEINELREANGLLTEQNLNLNQANEGLQETVAEATAANEELTTARATLMSEKEVLMEERSALASTVTMASVVKVGGVNVTGLRMKDNGKTVRKKYAKNVDLLNICFQTTTNDVTPVGSEEFYVRIINPLGETLAVEEMGSGVLTNSLTKEKVRYTKVAEHQFNNDISEICVTWDTPVQLSEGDYGVEVYNKGYLSGQGTFRLK